MFPRRRKGATKKLPQRCEALRQGREGKTRIIAGGCRLAEQLARRDRPYHQSNRHKGYPLSPGLSLTWVKTRRGLRSHSA